MKPGALKRMSGHELLQLFCWTLEELRGREMVSSTNNPVGDFTEKIVINALGLKGTRKSNAGHDATDSRGKRYQIKGRRITSHNPSRQLSFMRELESRPFDHLVGVLFDADFSVLRAAKIPFRVVRERARYSVHTKAHRFWLVDEVWQLNGVEDITRAIIKEANRLSK
ncbi:MAG: hypothetical protein U0638_13640 [Phycisphaerales bacterium]